MSDHFKIRRTIIKSGLFFAGAATIPMARGSEKDASENDRAEGGQETSPEFAFENSEGEQQDIKLTEGWIVAGGGVGGK